uniref:Uncharacterized protein n=1 Tax=viral metagenome TaxID=1070528 RepID=A0A6C0D6D6_9ZZZZ
MEVQTYNLLNTIKGSIRWIASRKPTMYQYGNNFVAVFWKIEDDQDHVYDMFYVKDDLDFYYRQVKSSFEIEYPSLNLDVKYNYGPVEIDSQIYSRIIYYFHEKQDHQYTNVFFAS